MTKCTHDPNLTTGPIGMYHCPDCGDMVLAGMDHPDMDEVDKQYEEYCDREMEKMMIWLNERLPQNEFINITQTMKNALMEFWLRADMNEDFNCCRCNKKTFAYRLYCSPFCEKADEIEQLEKK